MSISREVLSNYISVQTKRNFAVESGHYDSVFWIGNSGMRVYYDSDPWEIHFTPGSSYVPESNLTRYYNRLLYIKAFDVFVSYLSQKSTQIRPLAVISTNWNFFRFNEKLFTNIEKVIGFNERNIFIRTDNDSLGFKINLQEFINAKNRIEYEQTEMYKYLQIANMHMP